MQTTLALPLDEAERQPIFSFLVARLYALSP